MRGRRTGYRGGIRGGLNHVDGAVDGDGDVGDGSGNELDGVGGGEEEPPPVGLGDVGLGEVGDGLGSLLGSGLITGGGLVDLRVVGPVVGRVECTGMTDVAVVEWCREPDGRALLLCSRARVVAEVGWFAEVEWLPEAGLEIA